VFSRQILRYVRVSAYNDIKSLKSWSEMFPTSIVNDMSRKEAARNNCTSFVVKTPSSLRTLKINLYKIQVLKWLLDGWWNGFQRKRLQKRGSPRECKVERERQ